MAKCTCAFCGDDSFGIHVRCFEISASSMASVVILDELNLESLRNWGNGSATVQKRTIYKLPPLKGPIFVNQLAMKEWYEEDPAEKRHTRSNTKDAPNDLTSVPIIQIQARCALPDDDHSKNTGSEEEVDRDDAETGFEWVLALEYGVLGQEENDRCESTRDRGSDTPSCEDLCDTPPTPLNTTSTDSRKSNTDDTTDDTVTRLKIKQKKKKHKTPISKNKINKYKSLTLY